MKDDTDYRGRWKNTRRQHETYADTILAYVDAKVAAALCKGGVIAYLVDPGSGITDEWILQHVVPNLMRHGIELQVCKVLGRAMLWRLFDRSGDDCFPQHRRQQIMQAYRDLGSRNILEEGCNPIKKRPLVVSGHDTEVMMDLLEGELVGEGTSGVDAVRRGLAVRNQEVRLLSSQVIHLRRELADARAEADRQLGILKRQMARMNNNISRLANRPAKRLRITPAAMSAPVICDEEVVESAAPPSPVVPIFAAKLSGCPRSLHDLWLEYEFGFNGRKAAKDFTEKERGADKYRYYRRNVFWMKVSEMIRAGFTAERACDKIYSVYGARLPITRIINAMIRDKKDGGHPELRVIND
jgi:hypothetical protein